MKLTEEIITLLEENKIDKAVEKLIKEIESNPGEAVHYINVGNLFAGKQLYEQAERFYLKALEYDSEAATAYFGLGNLYYQTEHYKQAETVLQQAIKMKFHDADVYYLLGMTYVKQNSLLLALPFLQRASELRVDSNTLFQYGLVLAQTNHLREAEEVLQNSLKLDANHADALYNLGIIYMHADDLQKGRDFLLRALDANPQHHLAEKALNQLQMPE